MDVKALLFVAILHVSFVWAGSTCVMSSGEPGECKHIQNCTYAQSAMQTEKHTGIPANITSCTNQKDFVCCHDFLYDQGYVSVGSQKTEPKACGKRGSRYFFTPGAGGKAWGWTALFGKKTYLEGQEPFLYYFCNAVLISEEWLLAPGHCLWPHMLTGIKDLFVLLGEYDTSTTFDRDTQVLPIAILTIMPLNSMTDWSHDVGLIKLAVKATLKDHIQPICVPDVGTSAKDVVGKEAVHTGWAATGKGHKSLFEGLLNEGIVTIFDTSECATLTVYQQAGGLAEVYPGGVGPDKVVCAGDEQERDASCSGSSGSSLAIRDGRRFILVGMLISGESCARRPLPSLYVPVFAEENLRWIREIVFAETNISAV